MPSGDRKESEWIGIVTCSVSVSTLRKPWTQWPFPTACLWTFATHLEEHPHCCCGLQVWNQQLRGDWFPESYWSKLTNKRAFVYSTLSLCRLAGLAAKGFPISVWATRICFRHLKSMSIYLTFQISPLWRGVGCDLRVWPVASSEQLVTVLPTQAIKQLQFSWLSEWLQCSNCYV